MDGYCLKSGQRDGQVFLKEKKVALVIGNFYAHPQIENLKLIKLLYSHGTQLLRLNQWTRL